MTVSLQILAELKPQGLKVVGGMPFVRNSVGEGETDLQHLDVHCFVSRMLNVCRRIILCVW